MVQQRWKLTKTDNTNSREIFPCRSGSNKTCLTTMHCCDFHMSISFSSWYWKGICHLWLPRVKITTFVSKRNRSFTPVWREGRLTVRSPLSISWETNIKTASWFHWMIFIRISDTSLQLQLDWNFLLALRVAATVHRFAIRMQWGRRSWSWSFSANKPRGAVNEDVG